MSRILKVFFLAVITITIVGCSATPTRRSFNESWKDSIVSTKVKYRLTSDKLVKKRNIDVDAWRGVVTLTGRVISIEEKERAEQLAWQAKGVRGVDNFLKLVDDANMNTKQYSDLALEEEVAETTPTEKETKAIEATVATRGPASHPLKSLEDSTVNSKVEGPVVYEETPKVKKWRTKRSNYERPSSSQIQEEDLTSEEGLAREAAEELRRLRGEEDLAE